MNEHRTKLGRAATMAQGKANPTMDVDDLSARAKCSVGEENDRIKYAASCMKGHRLQMEDVIRI